MKNINIYDTKIYDIYDDFKESIREFISGAYMRRTARHFSRYFPSHKIRLNDGKTKIYERYPRWLLTIILDSTEEYERFNKLFNKIFGKTFFPKIVEQNATVEIFVKNHNGKDVYRYIL